MYAPSCIFGFGPGVAIRDTDTVENCPRQGFPNRWELKVLKKNSFVLILKR